MAKIVDIDNAPGDVDGLTKSLGEAVTATAEQNKVDEPKNDKVDDAGNNVVNNEDPLAGTKFEGKSVEDLLSSYKNLESAYGRMANDLGSQRKLTDRLLDLKRDDDLQSNAPVDPPKIDSAQLLENPTEALDRVMSDREARIRQEYDDRLTQFESQLAADRLLARHPDVVELGQSAEFQAWAQETPIRSQVAQRAAAGDFDAADALLTEYKADQKETINLKTPSEDTLKVDVDAAKKVALESSATPSPDGASSGKTYRRADMIQLKIERPDVWADPAFQAEILKAYSEGRVK